MINAKTKLCFVIGYPVGGSLSPIIHNAGLRELKLLGEYLFAGLEIRPENLRSFLDSIRSANVRGLSVTLPHKQTIMPLLDRIDETAEKIGAVNCVINQNGKLVGYNTDWIGAVGPLKALTSLRNKTVAIIGAGGAARAFAYGMTSEAASVVIFNRTKTKADKLAADFSCRAEDIDQINLISEFDIICNASSVGFAGKNQAETSPVPKKYISSRQIVFDAVYAPLKTKLLLEAAEKGAKTIAGTEMLIHHGLAQFKLFFNVAAPEIVMRKALKENLECQ